MSGGAIEHRASRVAMVTGLSTILSVALQLVSVPVCLKYWGQSAYGSWLALFSAFLLVRSLDAGYVTYVGNKLNYLYHLDTCALRAHLASGVSGIVAIGMLQLVLSIVVLMSDSVAEILGMPAVDSVNSLDRFGLLVMTASWVLTGSYVGIVHRLLIPAGLMYQAAWWFMAYQVNQFAVVMAVALLRLGLFQTCVLFSVSQLAIYLASAVYIRSKLPAFYPWWKGGRIRTGLTDLGQSSLLTAGNLIQQGATSGVVLLVSAFAGPVAVPVFTTVRTLANLWTNVTNVLSTPLLPDVVRFHAKGEVHKLVAANEAYWVLVGSAVNWGVLLSYPLLEPLYTYWTANTVALDKTLLCLLLASVVVNNAGALIAMYFSGMNRLHIVLSASVLRALFGLGGGAFGYGTIGLASFGVGLLAGEVAVLLMMGRLFARQEASVHGFRLSSGSILPAVLGTSSVLLFLLGEGFNLLSGAWVWIMTFAGAVAATVWGWTRLDPSVRVRLANLVFDKFKRGVACPPR